MVKPIEEQMLDVRKALDKERRRKFQALWDKKWEEERQENPKKKRRLVPELEVHKPWTRGAFPKLCQDTEWVATIYEYDYDLPNTEFQEYCRSRGVLHIAGTPGSKRWEFCVNHQWSADEFFEDDPSATDIGSDWRILRTARGKLQDCWELFRRDR